MAKAGLGAHFHPGWTALNEMIEALRRSEEGCRCCGRLNRIGGEAAGMPFCRECIRDLRSGLVALMNEDPSRKATYSADLCERCGHVGPAWQFQTHHRDRNRKNNSTDNLERLCIPCHRDEHSPYKRHERAA